MVFGGDQYTAKNNMEILNGTIWVTKELKYPRSDHAMVLLPCPADTATITTTPTTTRMAALLLGGTAKSVVSSGLE
jgi:hypothetical protein